MPTFPSRRSQFSALFWYSWLIISLFVFLLLNSCKKEFDPPTNPYNNPNLNEQPDTTDTVTTKIPPEASLAWLHQHIFAPTCANSGCHDGTFEPDFRTINSAYHTTVGHGLVKNDVNKPDITKRIMAGKSAESMLFYRLQNELSDGSQRMPLLANDSDWENNKTYYIDMIKKWIDSGAKNN
ncbi:MAG: hypothetical protein IPI59_04160 [Sphingobacteriales bacterium]|jgi:hypothetical protein|nr:hypothetical protein [Sphingobacteriales bacterium]MBP9140297.1 hypothetical protein [Chitinophagales bacterium]MDA0197176.1 hypothetical protein [Bacteroidota bacterium]MBK6891421.1 hypothetical protein [Sphingobacteriales bacterium]MBK7526747.1 hypothetical protein [Sphingobacteriales bacterium]